MADAGHLALACGAALLAGAVALAPVDVRSQESPVLAPPPADALLRTLALGRDEAAADVLWLRVVQYIGAPGSEGARYAGIEAWIEAIAELAPRFELPYLVAGILLATSPSRAQVADRLLERGEQVMPDRFVFPMQRGFVAYFGALNWRAAADHYRRASELPGAPGYLKQFAARLERNEQNCRALRDALSTVVAETDDRRQSDAMKQGAQEIFVNCAKAEIDRAGSGYRLDHGVYPPSIDELIAEGRLTGPPYAPRGQCWTLDGDRGRLGACLLKRAADGASDPERP